MYLLSSKKITQLVFVIFLIAVASVSISAQSKKKKSSAHPEPQKPVIIAENGNPVSVSSEDKTTASAKSSNIYIQSLRDQLAIREREVMVAKDNLDKTKLLFADGILSKREVEEAEVALVEAQTKADDIRRKLAAYEGKPIETNDATAKTVEKETEDEAEKDEVVLTSEKESNVKRTTQTRAKTPPKKSSVKKTKRP